MARPVTYRAHVAERILEGVANGHSINEMARRLRVPKDTVLGWAVDNRNGFGDRLREARVVQMLGYADQLIELSREARGKDMAGVTAVRVECDQIRWLLSRIIPSEFGERVRHQLGGSATVQVLLPSNGRFEDDGMLIEGEGVEVGDG